MIARKPLVATDRAALMLQLVPYLIGKGEVSIAEAADEFDVTPDQMRAMVVSLTVIGLPGDGGYWQMANDLFDIDWDLLDERDIVDLQLEQTGQLMLSSMPDRGFPFRVAKITPTSTALEGRNFFRVEAKPAAEDSKALRPGMQGVAKIVVDERRLVWIWTHKVVHWIRMSIWSWWP